MVSDDIVTQLRENAAHLVHIGYTSDAEEITQAIDEIERLRLTLHELSSHHSSQNAEQLRIVHAVEADRDHWRNIAEQAVAQLEQAVALLQALQEAVHG